MSDYTDKATVQNEKMPDQKNQPIRQDDKKPVDKTQTTVKK